MGSKGQRNDRRGQRDRGNEGRGRHDRQQDSRQPRHTPRPTHESKGLPSHRTPKKSVSPKVPSPGCRFVAGLHAVRAALTQHPENVRRLWVQNGSRVALQLVEELPLAAGRVEELSEEQLDALLGTQSHQGIGAEVLDTLACSLDELLLSLAQEDKRSLLVVLDGIEDPQNLGALFRVSECLGASGIILSRNRGAALTATASKAAVGATELLPRVEAANLVRTAEQLKAQGYWLVAASLREGSQPLCDFTFPDRCALVLGAEGRGIQPLLEKACDFAVNIPQLGNVQSLNVSQALSVILYEWVRQLKKGTTNLAETSAREA